MDVTEAVLAAAGAVAVAPVAALVPTVLVRRRLEILEAARGAYRPRLAVLPRTRALALVAMAVVALWRPVSLSALSRAL